MELLRIGLTITTFVCYGSFVMNNPTDDQINVRPLKDSDSLEELTEFLHRAYSVLAGMGLRYLATHQSADVTRSRISGGVCLVVVNGGTIVGTVTCYPPGHSTGSPWIERDHVAHFGQLGVDPNLRGQGIGARLVAAAEDQARAYDATDLALDTAEPATHLIDWYERLGYRFIEHADWDCTNYRSVVMSKELAPDIQ